MKICNVTADKTVKCAKIAKLSDLDINLQKYKSVKYSTYKYIQQLGSVIKRLLSVVDDIIWVQ